MSPLLYQLSYAASKPVILPFFARGLKLALITLHIEAEPVA